MTINRFCSSGLQSIALASERIMAGFARRASSPAAPKRMSLVPMGGLHFSPNPFLMEHYPDSYLTMGLTAENVARKYDITREQAGRVRAAQPPAGRWPPSPAASSRTRLCRWK